MKHVPGHIADLDRVEPQYVSVAGWEEDITVCRTFDELPVNTRKYIETVENMTGLPVTIVSVGPGREESILRKNPF